MENRLVHADNHPEKVSSFGIDDRRRRGKEKRCLGCLPIEILLIILNHFSVVDYMWFPFVCKCWRSAFLLCSPLISPKDAKRKELPWFVLLKLEPNSNSLVTTGKIGDLSTRCIYNRNIPELCGSRILLSRHGWLLLFSSFCEKRGGSSLFFLNPFSRARINIPLPLDDEDIMAGLSCCDTSAPPTSPDCIVFLVCCYEEEERDVRKISTCRRGESTWQTNIYEKVDTSPVVNTVFVDGILYCLHEHGFLSSFDVVTRSCGDIKTFYFGGPDLVSYVCQRGNNGVKYLCIYGIDVDEVELKSKNEPPTVSRTNSSTPEWEFRYCQINPDKGSELNLDTFNARAWCIGTGTGRLEGEMTFMWHAFEWRDYAFGAATHPPHNDCSMFVMWVQPFWVDRSSTNLSWMS